MAPGKQGTHQQPRPSGDGTAETRHSTYFLLTYFSNGCSTYPVIPIYPPRLILSFYDIQSKIMNEIFNLYSAFILMHYAST